MSAFDRFVPGAKPSEKPSKPTAKHGFGRTSNVKNKDKDLPAGVNLVDYSQIVRSTVSATYDPGEEIDINLMRHTILSTIKANVQRNRQKYPHVILCIDNAKGGYWRKRIAPYYKSKRKKQRDESGYDFSTIYEGMEIVKNELMADFPYTILDEPGFEADDHIGVLVPYFCARGVKVLITSSDGDFTQLHDIGDVKQWSPMMKKWVKPKLSPLKDLLFKCFKGDGKDGIASIKAPSDHCQNPKGRAKPFKTELLEKCLNAKESDLNLYLTDEEIERYHENRRLLDLRALPQNIVETTIEQYENYVTAPRRNIQRYLMRHDLKKLIPHANEF